MDRKSPRCTIYAVTFSEKLTRTIEEKGLRASEVARKAGMKPSVLGNYIKRGSEPLLGTAARIADALGVPLAWLADQKADWPPPSAKAGTDLNDVKNEDLLMQVARRCRLERIELRRAVERARSADLERVREESRTWKPSEVPPPESMKILAAHLLVELKYAEWNVDRFCASYHTRLPGSDMPPESLTSDAIRDEFRALGIPQDIWDWLDRMYREQRAQTMKVFADFLNRPPKPAAKPVQKVSHMEVRSNQSPGQLGVVKANDTKVMSTIRATNDAPKPRPKSTSPVLKK